MNQELMEEIDRLARLCEAKDAENKQLKKSFAEIQHNQATLIRDGQQQLSEAQSNLREQHQNQLDLLESIAELKQNLSKSQAQIAMQEKLLYEVKKLLHEIRTYKEYVEAIVKINDVLSATSETVAAWRAKETEPLRMEVAMLRSELNYSGTHDEDCGLFNNMECSCSFGAALDNTQATALAYEREVKAKALEEAATELDNRHLESLQMCILPSTMVREMAAELRANKGEVK